MRLSVIILPVAAIVIAATSAFPTADAVESCALSDQVPCATQPTLEEGASWAYEVRVNGDRAYAVTEEFGGYFKFSCPRGYDPCAKFDLIDPDLPYNMRGSPLYHGDYTPRLNIVAYESPKPGASWVSGCERLFHKFPMKVGDEWSFKTCGGEPGTIAGFTNTARVAAYEKVDVPYGTVWAFKIEYTAALGRDPSLPEQETVVHVIWFAPSVHMDVKEWWRDPQGGMHTSELVAYSPAPPETNSQN